VEPEARDRGRHEPDAKPGLYALRVRPARQLSLADLRNRERKYFYNAEGLLVRSEDSYGARVEFGYDAFRRRVWKRSEDAEVFYVWTGETMIAEIVKRRGAPDPRSANISTFRARRFPSRFAPEAGFITTTTTLSARRGRLTDDRGADRLVGGLHRFWPSRHPGPESDESPPLRGQYYDEETGFHYNRFPLLLPRLGRYISRDPVTFLRA